MTMSIPESVFAEGRVSAIFVPTLGSDSAAIWNAGVQIGPFLMPDWDGATPTQNTGEQRRFSTRQAFTRLGRTSWAIAPLMYTYLPQKLGTAGNAGNKLYEALKEGNKGFVGMFYDVVPGTTLQANDLGDVLPVECGVQGKNARGTDEFSPLTVTQTLAVTGIVRQDVKLVA
jgi:hypothetical protein